MARGMVVFCPRDGAWFNDLYFGEGKEDIQEDKFAKEAGVHEIIAYIE